MTAARVVTFGELLLRLSPPRDERLLQSPELRAWFGGAEANVAVGLAHLGVRADYVTRLPDNPLGDAAVRALMGEGVGAAWIVRGGERLGVYFVEAGTDLRPGRVVYDRSGSAFARLEPGMVDWSAALEGAGWFHGTGITPALGDGPAAALGAALAAARARGARTSIDLNYRPALWNGRDPRPLVEPLVRNVDLLIANPSAARAMLGVDADERALATSQGARDLAHRLTERCGCGDVALTRREVLSASRHGWSATLYEARTGSIAASRRYEVRVLDRVGGGDAFAAALIAALLWGRAPAEAVQFAAAAGALKLTIPGDWNRVTTDEIDRLVGGCT